MNKHGLYDINDTWHVPFWQTKIFYGIMILLLCGVLAIVFKYLLKKYRNRAVHVPFDQRTLAELRSFKDRGLINANNGKEFYLALTATLKAYLNERYGIEIQGKTDEELLQYLASLGFSAPLFADLQSIFSGMSMVKFANMQSAQEQIERDWQRSIAFVQQTAPRQS